MKTFILSFLFCNFALSVKHSFILFITASSGIPIVPEFIGATDVDGIQVFHCDTNKMTVEPKQDWVKKLLARDPQHLERQKYECFTHRSNFFKARINDFKQLFNQSGGVHVLQAMTGCQWDDETEEVKGFNQYGYEGEDFISLDLNSSTWTALKPQAEQIKKIWDTEKDRIKRNKNFLIHMCPELLKKYLEFGNSSLQRTECPSVSLLQKTPSSPVSCHATGFYPDRSSLFWRKDGEEIHEDVDHREILPNHDGTFQMSVDLNLSSVTPEDWRRYDCVFQLSGMKDVIVTRLDKDVIRTNWEKPSNMILPVTAAVVVLALILITVTGFIVYKRNKAPDTGSELTDRPNPDLTDKRTQ